jgi:uncharacterized protein
MKFMTLFALQPSIAHLEVKILPDGALGFIDWQGDFNAAVVQAPGFISLEFSSAPQGWAIVQRFSDPEALNKWQTSHEYLQLIEKLQPLASHLVAKEPEEKGNVTEVIVTEVSPEKEEEYRAWSAKIHHIEAKFPGFRGVYVQSPEGKGQHWITLLQFDSMANLDKWLQSPERKEVLKESFPLISSLETHRVISPYSAWFASIAKTGSLPPVWKQTMLVLLVLFPIVMLELKFLIPLTASWNKSPGMFLGNAISVVLISFPMMPIAIKLLGWWLTPDSVKTTIIGTLLVLALYAIEIAVFWSIV